MAQPQTSTEARERLAVHADARQDGFLGRLWHHGPDRAAFDDLVTAIGPLARTLRHAPTFDRVLVQQLWSIGYYARNWALHPDGRLVRGGRISVEDQARLARWVAAFEWAVAAWLAGEDDTTALALYRDLDR